MRNDSARWDAPGPLRFSSDDLTIQDVTLPKQTWVSGTDVLARYKDQLVTWPTVVTAETYALSLRRDRVLLIGETDLAEGYSAETRLAVSDVSDAYQVIDISGPAAFQRLCHGAELNLEAHSASVMRRAFGADVMLYRHGHTTNFRLHVARALMQSVFRQLIG